jgi:signal transduction histidine kinase
MKGTLRVEEHELKQIRKLTEVSRALTYAATLDEVFQLTVLRAAELLGGEKSLLLMTNDTGLLSLRASHGINGTFARGFREPLSEKLVPRLAVLLDVPPGDFLGVPLVVGGAIKGLLIVIRPGAATNAERDEWILSALADQAAAAVEKTRLDEIAVFREQLIGIIGHDLRNPLSTILMGAHLLLQREGLAEKETELARRISRSAMVAVRLIDQLLDLTRSRLGGGISIDPRRLDMKHVLKQVTEETELGHPDRPLRLDVRGDLIGVWDRDRMYQLLSNLVGNAVQHGEPRSTIELRVDGEETEVVIEVANRGEPIPPEAMPHIFDAFRKGRTIEPFGTQGPGLGLGLFIAHQITRSHGGSIGVTSSAIDGTIFRVRLPRSAAVAAEPAARKRDI